MATTDIDTDSDDDESINKTADGYKTDERWFTLKGEGKARRTKSTGTNSASFDVTDEVKIDFVQQIGVSEAVELLTEKQTYSSSRQFRRGVKERPKSLLLDAINDTLSTDECEIETDHVESWDVSFDGNVRAWLDFFEELPLPLKKVQAIEDNDVWGDGFDAAVCELRRRFK